ncbi:MAG: hypothetical protein JO097_06580 [Acidobacteriaceae bacterium]|nr:hypothetical protein [Acidobacteriaceae bacterium]MBV9294310.1 hypothetical protein [Acidobacteriaceae bacterium]MBV9763738.1 hypothetical protein [Acidobacteriaceae bacterium]
MRRYLRDRKASRHNAVIPTYASDLLEQDGDGQVGQQVFAGSAELLLASRSSHGRPPGIQAGRLMKRSCLARTTPLWLAIVDIKGILTAPRSGQTVTSIPAGVVRYVKTQ